MFNSILPKVFDISEDINNLLINNLLPNDSPYKNIPKYSQTNPYIRLDFVNGHLRYFYKFGLLTNGWGIPLSIKFFKKPSINL